LNQTPIQRLIMTRSSKPIPEALVRLTHRGRSYPGHSGRRRRNLAKEHGLYTVAHALKLDYIRLKKRVGGSALRRRKSAPPRFVELIAPGPVGDALQAMQDAFFCFADAV